MPGLHEQLAVTGWQNIPGCAPLPSVAQVYPVGHSPGPVHAVAQ